MLALGRRHLYRAGWLVQTRLPVPVVVVGNITVGGSGKTPLVIHLARTLRERGYRPGVVSRGYGADAGRRRDATREVLPDCAPRDCGDEPLLIRRRTGCPVFIGAERAAAGVALLAMHPEVDIIIADDGLQHLQLARDYEIAVFDARGCGNGRLLPAGPLREARSRLASVDAVVAQDGGAPDGSRAMSMTLEFDDFHALADPRKTCPARSFATRQSAQVAAVAGIGNPARFFAQLRGIGLTVREFPFPDHHAFAPDDLARIEAGAILMTEKDALKCSTFGDSRTWVAPVTASVAAELVASIVEKLLGSKTA